VVLLKNLKKPKKKSVSAKIKSPKGQKPLMFPGDSTLLQRLLNKSQRRQRVMAKRRRKRVLRVAKSPSNLITTPRFKMRVRQMASKMMSHLAALFL